MTQTPTSIHETVREHYAERIKSSASCCGPSDCCSTESRLYPVDLLATLPTDVSSTSYGCGDPITLAALKPGETVLDLGSGAGLDCLLAAQKVGPEGRVIGVDMTPEMIERAQSNAKRVNATNVEFRQGLSRKPTRRKQHHQRHHLELRHQPLTRQGESIYRGISCARTQRQTRCFRHRYRWSSARAGQTKFERVGWLCGRRS